jgi:hypothetical protein
LFFAAAKTVLIFSTTFGSILHIVPKIHEECPLNSVIDVSFRATWENLVYVLDEDNREHAIKGPLEALRFLQDDMAEQSGHTYCSAVLVCMAAIKGSRHVARSRDTFVSAYVEYRLDLTG